MIYADGAGASIIASFQYYLSTDGADITEMISSRFVICAIFGLFGSLAAAFLAIKAIIDAFQDEDGVEALGLSIQKCSQTAQGCFSNNTGLE